MKRVVLMAALALMFSTFALADGISYSTSGSFTTSTATVIAGGLQFGSGGNTLDLTFAGSGPVSGIIAPNGAVPLGSLTTVLTGSASGLDITGTDSTFSLQVTQTQPGPTGSQTFTGNLTGNITYTPTTTGPGSLLISFLNTSITINGVTYTLNNLGNGGLPDNELSVSLSGGNGTANTSLSASVVTPEPASLALFGTGLFGLAGLARRRLAKL